MHPSFNLGTTESMDPPPPTTTTISNRTDSSTCWVDEHLAQVPAGSKLRLMCSYGGHIIPTPHEKSLRYIGGDTRMVALDRRSSLASILSRLSSSLLHGRRNFSLKYQLPTEDLDNLVSLTSQEDFDNLIEEYDRIIVATSSSNKPAFRIRLFVFFAKPETAASMGSLLDDAKSETWFVDALNSASLLPRGLSDSAAVDQLLDLDNEGSDPHQSTIAKQTLALDAQDMLAGMSDSPIVENSSPSFGSSSSSPSMSNLPPIRIQLEESVTVGIDEQFAQTVVSKGTSACFDVVQNVDSAVNPGEVNRVQAAQVGFRKPPLPISLPPQQVQQHKNGLPYNLPSPDSVASNSSIASESSQSKLMLSQDPLQITVKENRAPASHTDPQKAVHESNPPDQMMQLHETTYQMPPQSDHLYSQQRQQMQQHLHQQQQLHQLKQQHYFNASMPPDSETHYQMQLVEQSDQHPNTDFQDTGSQNQRMQHLHETVYLSSPQSTDHQQQLFIHPSMRQSYETSIVQGPVSEQLGQHLQQQQKQFVTSSMQHVYHPPINQAEQLQEQEVQRRYNQGSMQYVHQASTGQVPMPSYYSMYTHPPHQQLHHQTMYMLPYAQTQPYNAAVQSKNISDMSPPRLPTTPTASMLPPPASAYKETQPEKTSSTLLMSANPTLIQVPSSQQQQQQYISCSQFHHPPQSMATYGYGYTAKDPQVYYTNQQHPSAVPQYQTMNSASHGHGVAPSEAVSPPPPAYQD